MKTRKDNAPALPVAIVGMGCFFPKAPGLKAFWRLLFQGEDAITEVPETHWRPEDYFDEDPKAPDRVYCKRGGFLPRIPFDPAEFGIPPTTLEATDTSQLLGLMAAKAALENAGYGNGKPFNRERTSVILGVTGTQELVIPLGARLGHPIWRKALRDAGVSGPQADAAVKQISEAYVPWQENSFPGLLGNVVAGRICNRLDLGGANCVVDAACASSLSAVHLALLELTSGRSDMVITGGVDALNDIFMHMCFSKTRILSPTGDIRPFSKDADGTVLGEGVGLLALKRLADAERDGDRIYAVIKGLGASSDGKSQSIYAPRAEGQARALRAAYDAAGVAPETVGLIEAHGTGTRVGDRVEFQALKQVFGRAENGRRCAIGSVKSMIGHTKAAAGAAGLIKTALALYHKVLPPTLKADEPDPGLDIGKSPFCINAGARPWVAEAGHPRRAGVSSFGFGGSNFHIVLEEHHGGKGDVSWDGSVEMFAFSAKSREALIREVSDARGALGDGAPDDRIARKAWETRQQFSHQAPFRFVMTAERGRDATAMLAEALAALESRPSDVPWDGRHMYYGTGAPPGKIAFVFPGQGSQYVGMGRDIISLFPRALEALEAADAAFVRRDVRISQAIFPPPGLSRAEKSRQEEFLRRTETAQPAIGAVSMGMFRVLRDFGISPDAACGHSYGEITALYAAGWIEAAAFFSITEARGRLMASAGGGDGAMLAVKAPLDAVERLIQTAGGDLVLANRNSPEQGVVSGPASDIRRFEARCADNGLKTIRLPVSAAFHTPVMGRIRRPFSQALSAVKITPTGAPVFSNVTGAPYPDDPEAARRQLADQITSPVNFIADIENMYRAGVRTFVETGPRSVLCGLIRSILEQKDVTLLAMDGASGRRSGAADLARVLAKAAALGYSAAVEKWESHEPAAAQRRMSVPISGANYRPTPKPVKPKKDAADAPSLPHRPEPSVSETENQRKPRPRTAAIAHKKSFPKAMNDIKKIDPARCRVTDALGAVQEGLRSMQALQLQTAEAHKKFLETQSEASRTLQQMMDSACRLAEITGDARTAIGGFGMQLAGRVPEADDVTPPPAPAPPDPARPTTAEKATSHDVPPAPAGPADSADSGRSCPREDIRAALRAIVSELTGYPEEMIALDMDIEADLGVDSIKRVEILSGIEEKMPDLPRISPDMAGSLKTLEQVARHLENQAHAGPAATCVREAPAPAADAGVAEKTLLDVVSRLTGYPVDMLAMDMDIEADLGIDSIKRVEIFSSLEENMPGLPTVSPDDMGRLKTLGQVVEFICSAPTRTRTAASTPEKAPAKSADGESAINSCGGNAATADALIEVVSRLTGYPPEMLAMDMDIEADLGIDSIKRVEIFSALEERLPGLPSVPPEEIGKLKTLEQIARFLSAPEAEASRAPRPENESFRSAAEAAPAVSAIDNQNDDVKRQIVTLVETPFVQGKSVCIPHGRSVWVAGDPALGAEIVRGFESVGIDARQMPVEQAMDAPDARSAGGLILVWDADDIAEDDAVTRLKAFFTLARKLAPSLMDSAAAGGAVFAAVTRLDGAFGFDGKPLTAPVQGGLAGLVKTAALEWDGVHCRALDIDPDWEDGPSIGWAVVREVLQPGPAETGLTADRRVVPTLQAAPFPTGEIDLRPGDVVVVSGGGRGVTAEAALALARRIQPTVLLLGRSPAPRPEPDWLARADGEADMKQAILTHEFEGNGVSPKTLEAAFKKWKANRELLETLKRLKEAGATVVYRSADVRDAAAVKSIFDAVRVQHGPIKALIHGAGVLEDRLIADKTPEQVDRVLGVKINGLRAMLGAAGRDPLRYIVLFSSAAARAGNKGQADYAMANEALNKIARQEALLRPDTRVISINWGPWDGGMVTPALKREFQRRQVRLIPPEAGAEAMLREMSGDRRNPVETVIGASMLSAPRSAAIDDERDVPPLAAVAKPEGASLSVSFQREIDVARYPVLASHVLDGKPVVPFALIAEWLGHGALHENPGLCLRGLDDLRLLNGIKLDEEKKLIRMMTGKARRKDSLYEVDVEIRDGVREGATLIHSRARALLGDAPDRPPIFASFDRLNLKEYTRSADEIYEKILFHGVALRGIKEVMRHSEKGMTARLASAPMPAEWMAEPLRSRWISDPLIIDAAFQMSIVWCYEHMGAPSLPAYVAAYRQYCRQYPKDGVTAVMEVREAGRRKMTADFSFLDAADNVLGGITGFECVMDPALFKAFELREPVSAVA